MGFNELYASRHLARRLDRAAYGRRVSDRRWQWRAVIALAGAVGYINDPAGGNAGTASISERIRQDGTAAHPYGMPADVRLALIWSFGPVAARPRASLPAYRSVLLGNQSPNGKTIDRLSSRLATSY
jgi:hypothetical protein